MNVLEKALNYWVERTTPMQGDKTLMSSDERERHRKHRVLSISMLLAISLSFPLVFLDANHLFSLAEISILLYEVSMIACVLYNRQGRLNTAVIVYIGSFVVLSAWGLWNVSGSQILWSWTQLIITPILSGLFLSWWSSVVFGFLAVGVADIELRHFQMGSAQAHFITSSEYVMLYTYVFIILMALSTLGALYAFNLEKAIEGADRANEIERAHAALEMAHIDLAHAYQRAEHLSHCDALTGLLNHRAFNGALEHLMEHSDPQQEIVMVLFCDIDFFKRINDTYGHPAGDAALQSLAERLQNFFGSDAIIGRYGGEEFVAASTLKVNGCLSEGDQKNRCLQKMIAIAEQLRLSIAEMQIMFEGRRVSDGDPLLFSITISVGIAAYPIHAQTLEELISNADSAMYLAKRQGRNQVCLATQYITVEAA